MDLDVAESGAKSWREVFAELWQTAVRHKLVAAVIATAVAGSLAGIAVGLSGSGAPAAASSDSAASPDSWAVQPAGRPAAPSFRLPLLGRSGQVSLAGYDGRPVIVNFFASWCTPCQRETPMLARYYHSGSHIALVGIDGGDESAKALRFAHASGVTYPVGWDPGISAGLAYQVSGVPQTFFLDARHRVVYRVFGPVSAAQLARGVALATG